MATTTNYGWTTPDDTALVKDGAAAIRSLGSAIDTSMNTALGTKKAGLVLLNTTSFSAVSSVSFPNNTFTSSYNTYFFTFDLTGSAAISLQMRVRAAGSDNTSTVYNRTQWEGNTAPITVATSTGQTSAIIGDLYDSDAKRQPLYFTLNNVEVSVRYTTGHSINTVNADSAGPYPVERWIAVTVTTSYDSITFLTSSGTMTGSITCYGYNQ